MLLRVVWRRRTKVAAAHMERTSSNANAIIIITAIMRSAAGCRGSATPKMSNARCTWLKVGLYSLPQAHQTSVGLLAE